MERKLTVGYHFKKQRQGSRNLEQCPKILITGDWLKGAGFEIGQIIRVVVGTDSIQIVKADKQA